MDLINEKHQQIHELKAYLTATDHKVTKSFEQGYVIDANELQQRENTRQQISTLEIEIAEIEKKLSELQEGEEYIPEVLTQETVVENDKYTTNYFANGVLIETKISYKQQPIINRVENIETATSEVIQTLVDPRALKIIDAYPEWKTGEIVIVGEKRKRGGLLFKCLQPHTTQADWSPDITPALWKVVQPEGVIPDFKQPTGVHDAYKIGDKVKFNGNVYESLINANTYSPTAYPAGWKKL